MATDTVILHLPDDLYRRIARLSHLTSSPMEGVIVRMLSSSLPPLPDDFAPDTRDALQALESLSDRELVTYETAHIAPADYARLTELRERQRDGLMTPNEQTELDRLMQAADLLTLQKAYAAVLLKWRGQAQDRRPRRHSALPDA